MMVVGADADSVALANQLAGSGSGVTVVGFLDDYLPIGSVVGHGLKVLGRPRSLLKLAKRTGAADVIVVPQALPWETVQALMSEAAATPNGLRLHLSAGFYELLITKVRLSERNRVPLLTVTKANLSPFETTFKVSLDYLLATSLLVAFSPILAWTILRLRSSGARTVLERRPVIGRFGRQFNQFSFRSNGNLGRDFVRKLPGLINVLSGQLSLVGPRPIGVDEVSSVATVKRQAIRPGLTGPWRQVEDAKEQAILDLYYIRSYTIWLDLQVLFTRLRARLHPKNRHSESIKARALHGTAR
jgi:lipopolysaccharide/colanic/teichoic acid biosynthesis glycosyltransferase